MVSEVIDVDTFEGFTPQLKTTLIDFNVAKCFKTQTEEHNGQKKVLLMTNTGN